MNTTNQTASQKPAAAKTIKFSFILGTSEEVETTETYWKGRGAKKRRDVRLSEALPSFTEESIEILDKQKLAEFLSDCYLDIVKRIKCQRFEIGDSYSLTVPADSTEFAIFAFSSLTESSREKKLLSAQTIRDCINSEEFKKAATSYCLNQAIKPDSFAKIVIDEFFRRTSSNEFQIYNSRATVAVKAATHLLALAELIATTAPIHAQTLILGANRIHGAEIVADEGDI